MDDTYTNDLSHPPSPKGEQAYLVISEHIEKLPFNEDFEEGLPDGYIKIYSTSTEITFDESEDIVFETEDDLVSKYYKKIGRPCPFPICTYIDLYGKTMTGIDDNSYPINELLIYYAYYGIEMENLYFIHSIPIVMAVCENAEQCHKLIRRNKSELNHPRIISVPKYTLLTDKYMIPLP